MNGTKVLGLAAVGVFLVMTVPVGSVQAMSLINPGAAATVQQDAKLPTTQVRWHWHHHHWHHHHWHHRWHRHGHWHRWHHHRHW